MDMFGVQATEDRLYSLIARIVAIEEQELKFQITNDLLLSKSHKTPLSSFALKFFILIKTSEDIE
jgi:hypothetical protein